MFGDQFRSPRDSLDLDQKYPGYNLKQSMFKRFVSANKCVLKLKYTYRFSESIFKFLNEFHYENLLRTVYNRNKIKGFGLIHSDRDSHMFNLMERFMAFASPKKYSYAIILPPNILPTCMDDTLG